MADWDPELYHRFRRYRSEPVEAILARLRFGEHERIIDLGCGTGEHTLALASRAARGSALGIDSSPAMIEQAEQLRASLAPGLGSRLQFKLQDIAGFAAERAYSVIFSNATLQWVPNHRELFKRCFEALTPLGQLVVQVPANESETAQLTLTALAREAAWGESLGAIAVPAKGRSGEPADYQELLAGLGFTAIDCYYQTFAHPMESPAEVLQWIQATTLRNFLQALPVERHREFLEQLRERLEQAYGTTGALIYKFRRLFLWAQRPAG